MGFPVKPIKGETSYSTRLTKPSKTGFKERPVVAAAGWRADVRLIALWFFCGSANHGSIHDVLHLLAIVLPEITGRCRAHHHDKMLLGIAKELRAIGAVPGEFTGVAGHRRQTLMRADRYAKTETESAAMWLDVSDVVLDFGTKMV